MQERKAVLLTYPEPFIRDEFVDLALAAEYHPSSVKTSKNLVYSKYGVGEGKALEIKELVKDLDASVILIDEKLRSSQEYNLAKLAGVQVKDREKLILEIFNRRASSAEAKLQVKLAELSYEMSRAKEKLKLAKSGEQPGFFGLGKYEVDRYQRDIRRRVSTVNRKLEEARKRRELYRASRKRFEFPMVSLSGYTGAGKTSLFNRLTQESKTTGEGVFTTLSTCTRALLLNSKKVLLSDTVGFISRLPAYMIEAFKSTLEELTYSDLVLLVLDASLVTDELSIKLESCEKTLADLSVSPSQVLYVLNKSDLTTAEEVTEKVALLQLHPDRMVRVSAKTGEGLEELKSVVLKNLEVSPIVLK